MAGDTAQVHAAADGAHEGGGGRAGVRAGGAAARRHRDARARHRAERGGAGRRHGRGHLRAVRRRAGGGRPGVPRARRAHPRPARLGRREGRGRRPTPSSSSTCCSRSTATRRPGRRPGLVGGPARGARARAAAGRRAGAGVARRAARQQGVGPGAAARRQARARGDRAAQRRARARAAPHPARGRPDHPQPGAAGDPGGARPAVGPAADRVLRRLAQPGHVPVGVDGGVRGRARAQERVPPVHHPRARGAGRARRHRGDARGHHAAVPALPRGPRGRAGRRARHRARTTTTSRCAPGPIDEVTGKPVRFAYPPNLVVVDGGPPQVAAAAAAMAELGIDDVALCRAGQAARGGLAAGGGVPGDPAAQLRGPLPAAAAPRRGAPVRDHRAPQAAQQGHDGVGARRRARARPGAAGGAAAALRVRQAAARRRRSRRSRRCRAWGTGPRRPSSRRWRAPGENCAVPAASDQVPESAGMLDA